MPVKHQLDLFGSRHADTELGPAEVPLDLRSVAERLPSIVRLATSSWSFPGWESLVYDRCASKARLAREGLEAYARHPLFCAAGIDRTYYSPLAASEFKRYAASVRPEFRFFVKAHRNLTTPFVEAAPGRVGEANDLFLNARYAEKYVIRPVLEGLGDKAGPILFQFPPGTARFVKDSREFVKRLDEFLGRLPAWHLYAVEIRNRRLYTDEYFAVLRGHGVHHCLTVHPGAPTVTDQAGRLSGDENALIVRWNLRPGRGYEEAKRLYDPFNKLVEPDLVNREAIADLCRTAVSRKQEVYVVANNKAEGCAPLTLVELAKAILTAG